MVVAKYISGHSKESWYRNIPASLLLKNRFPISFPYMKKVDPDIIPMISQKLMLFSHSLDI